MIFRWSLAPRKKQQRCSLSRSERRSRGHRSEKKSPSLINQSLLQLHHFLLFKCRFVNMTRHSFTFPLPLNPWCLSSYISSSCIICRRSPVMPCSSTPLCLCSRLFFLCERCALSSPSLSLASVGSHWLIINTAYHCKTEL